VVNVVKVDRLAKAREAREASTRLPWERQFGESQKAFGAFCVYRDLGMKRSQEKVARELGKSAQLLARWSVKWNWVERIEAWVDEQDRMARIDQVEAVSRMNKFHALMSAALVEKAFRKINGVKDSEIEKMSLVSASRLLEVGVKVERQARGEAGEVVQDKELSEGGLSHLTVEELEKIERIHEIASSRSGSGENGIGNKAVS